MDGQAYREVVRRARICIERGTAEDEQRVGAAEKCIYPKQMESICAVYGWKERNGRDG